MSNHDLSHDALLTLGRLGVENTLADPAMLAALAPYNYTEAELTALGGVLDDYEARILAQRDLYGQLEGATEALRTAWDAFRAETYTPHVTLARLVFKDDAGARRRLGLHARRKQSFSGWLQQARQFYAIAAEDADLSAALATRGITTEALTEARAELEALEALDTAQENLKGLAQQATRDRDTVRRSVLDDLGTFHRLADLGFAENPDWQERIGRVAR